MLGAKTMTPSRLHVPPRFAGASARIWAGPPDASIFLSFPPAKNPMKLLSGDQKGWLASSVLGNFCALSESTGRIQRDLLPSSPTAEKTSRRPSGETKSPLAWNVVVAGG